ncbi:tol-pal system-associated acyl-CoA thioesterase [Nitrosomonas oligotropha]|uniref:Acyl-CoA thioester hydrolase n=1 Tax=Nitrosomonas oligotropha TaxID=42354 RepID=A0A1H8NQN3_9PROT|nr:tol-pal system-associated acyl-CoA thioesterase [Nitrosomonas oligotropha]PTQ78544.1 acyl-CoA thioester hydrolase [Nitrosomonas oligotropha]SDW62668.1 acyl-CoA thioester hydrolase [Nitrosomonas oligotropha]SEO31916.1 acyl-CoA thioester hydrolase [Nitrosomonas oligotropha]
MLNDNFSLPVRVYYQDTDAGGVVYHSTYLNFMERARYEWLRALGFNVHSMVEVHNMLFMVRSLEVEYLKPAILDNLLHVSVAVTEVGRSRIALFQEIICNHVKLVSATIQVVCVGADTLKPMRIPAPLREKIGKVA